jgi:1,2-diacylglycerol 3-alpha-glucosyltransferase
MFFALKGENFDGNEYAMKALEAGAAYAVVNADSVAGKIDDPRLVKVEDTLKGYGLAAPISVVPSGIRLEQHSHRISRLERAEARLELGICEDDIVLLNIGRLGNEKNLDELVRFFADVRPNHPKLKFLIVGDGPAREELEKLAHTLDVQEYISFTGMVAPDRLQRYY